MIVSSTMKGATELPCRQNASGAWAAVTSEDNNVKEGMPSEYAAISIALGCASSSMFSSFFVYHSDPLGEIY